MAAVRLRKAFRYPDDLDETDQADLDEQEQEQLIEQLQHQNDTRNAQYHVIFTLIPVLATLPFLSMLFSPSASSNGAGTGTMTHRLLSLLSIFSLLTTAYTMRLAPIHPDRKGKKAITATSARRDRIHAALVSVNGVVCLLLGLVYAWTRASPVGMPVLYLIPGVLLAVILIARQTMLSVDLSTLKDLQYEYKGA